MTNKTGLVVKAISSFFYVEISTGEVIECRASKKLKLNKQMILTGDNVVYDEETSYISEVVARSNELLRPKVSNVENAVLVFSVIEPEISYTLLDKMLLTLEINNLDVVIFLTKIDKISSEEFEVIKKHFEYYEQIGYKVIYKTGEYMSQLNALLEKEKYVFTGQSGVGKSTLINELIPGSDIKTQEISKALSRGKHTTREVVFYKYLDSYIIDTPGFSSLEINLTKEQVRDHFVDLYALASECRFNGCYHLNEPNCNVKVHLKENIYFDQRYSNYVTLQESEEKW